GLAGAGWPGQKLEGMRLDAKAEVAQDLGPQAVAQTDVLEPDHMPLRKGGAAPSPMRTLYRNRNSIGVGLPFGRFHGLARLPWPCVAAWRHKPMVSGPLTKAR